MRLDSMSNMVDKAGGQLFILQSDCCYFREDYEKVVTTRRGTRVCNKIPQQGTNAGPSAANTLPAPKQQQACPRCLQAWAHAEC